MSRLYVTLTAVAVCAGANAQVLMDQIGPNNAGQIGQGLFASQNYEPTNDPLDIIAIDDFTIAGPAHITSVEAVMGMWNHASISWGNVTGFRIEIFSSTAAATGSLTGNVASVLVPIGNVNQDPTWIGGANLISRIHIPALNIHIGSAGTYWIGIMGDLHFELAGQIGVSGSTFGGGGTNAFHANPGGGHALPGNGMTITPPTNLAYRVNGTIVPEPGTFIAIGLALAGMAIARRRK